MNAGDLSTYLRLETLQGTTTRDTRGQSQKQFAPVLDGIPAKVTTLSGLELIRARQLVAQATHRVELRYLSDLADLKTKAQFVLADPLGANAERALHIEHVDDVEQRRADMVCLCTEDKP